MKSLTSSEAAAKAKWTAHRPLFLLQSLEFSSQPLRLQTQRLRKTEFFTIT